MNIMLEKRGRWLMALALLFCFFIGNAKKTLTYDEKLTNAINALDWFALDSLYKAVPKDSIEPFNDIYSRCLIGNRFNRPEVSLPAFSELFNTGFKKHSLENLLTFAKMYSTDLSQAGENRKAVSFLTTSLDSTKQELGERAIIIEQLISKYQGLSSFSPYDISFEAENGVIPFHIDTIGEKENMMIYLEDSYINGRKANITFDTGAPVNLISFSLAKEFQLIPIDGEVTLNGIGKQEAVFAIAKELKIGNIIAHDVPFCVMDIKTNNEEADQLAKFFDLIVGSELMLHLKDVTIDFTKNEMLVPANAPQKSNVKPNFCFSPMMNLLAKGSIHNNEMRMIIDTGNGGNGILDENFFKANKKFVKSTGKLETVRNGGIGGVHIAQCYQVPDMKLELGGSSVTVPMMQVFLKSAPYNHECNLGLKALMLFKKIRFNMVDFVISTEVADHAELESKENPFPCCFHQQAEFPGGNKALMEFIKQNLKYPESSACIEGRVIVTVTIDSLGNVCNPKVIRGLEPSFDQEALRVVSLLPKFKPGALNGKKINTTMIIPISWKLEDCRKESNE